MELVCGPPGRGVSLQQVSAELGFVFNSAFLDRYFQLILQKWLVQDLSLIQAWSSAQEALVLLRVSGGGGSLCWDGPLRGTGAALPAWHPGWREECGSVTRNRF